MKAFTALTLLTLVYLASSQGCNNPLLPLLNITGAYSEPTVVTDLQYCTNLELYSCCPADVLNQLQNISDQVTNQIQNLAGLRDLDISQTQTNILPDFQNLITQFNNQLDGIQNTNQSAWNILNKAFKQFKSVAPSAQSAVAHLNNTLGQLQNSRVGCYQTLLLIQSAAYCLACDPLYADNGVNPNGTINLSPALCTQMQENCYDFLADSASMSVLVTVQEYSSLLQQAMAYMTNLTTGVTPYPGSVTDVPIFVTPTGPGGKKQKKVSIPSSCTQGNCPWICNNFFQSGNINLSNLAAGGEQSDTTDFEASSSDDDTLTNTTTNSTSGGNGGGNKSASRLLQEATTWDFDPADVGVTIVVVSNPAAIPESAVIHFGSFALMVAVLVAMLF
jgi:hypothetical protein